MTITSAQLEKIIEQLNQLENRVESDTVAIEISKVKRQLKKWDDQGQPGEFPFWEQLRAWNVEIPDGNAGAVDVSPVLEQKPEPVSAVALTAKQEFDLNNAKDLANQGKFAQALEILDRLSNESFNNTQVSAWKLDIENRFNVKTIEMENQAESFCSQFPQDFAGQRQQWNSVLEFNPGSEKAKAALANISMLFSSNDEKEAIEECNDIAERASQKKDLLSINSAVGEIAKLLNSPLSYANKLEAQKVQQNILTLRNKLRDELGTATTTSVSQGQERPAYANALDYLRQNVPVVFDADNLMGKGRDVEIPTIEFFQYLRPKFLGGLEKLASERITAARGALTQSETNPSAAFQTAKVTLLAALDLLNDEILTHDDKIYLGNMRSLVESELEKVNSEIAKYSQADEKIKSADDNQKTLTDRLSLLEEARKLFPFHPALKYSFDEIRKQLAQKAERDADKAIRDASFSVSEDNFTEALAILETAKKAASKLLVGSELGDALALVTARLDDTSNQVKIQQAAYERMVTAIRNCKTALTKYETTKDENDLRAAGDILEGIAPEFKQHPLVVESQRDFSRHQADPVKWEVGSQAYRKAQWGEAINNLSQIKSDFPHFAEAQGLVKRAQAAQKYKDGAAAFTEKKWSDAKILYTAALLDFEGDPVKGTQGVGTDEYTQPLVERCRQELENLKPIAEGEEKIALLLDKLKKELDAVQKSAAARHLPADKVDLQPAFSRIVDDLSKARLEAMSRADDLTILLSQVRQEWHKAYLDGMRAGLESKDVNLMKRALLQADELEKYGLLAEADKQLRYKIQAEMLDTEYRQWFPDASEQTLLVNVDWDQVEKNRRNRFDVESRIGFLFSKNTPEWEASEARKAALRKDILTITNKRIQREVDQKLETGLHALEESQQKSGRSRETTQKARQDVYRAAAIFLGTQMRDNPVLRDDLNLMEKWIHLAWQANDWNQAAEISRKFIEYGVYNDGRHLDEFFRTLTQAARAYAENNIQRGEAYLEQLNNQDKDWVANHHSLLQAQRTFLHQDVKMRLLQEAEEDYALKTAQAYLSAAQKYSILYQLDPFDNIVKQGLEDCGKHIGVGLESVFVRAERMKLGNKSLDDAIREVETVVLELDGIKSVASLLNLGRDMQSRLDDALETASRYKNLWLAVNKQMAKCAKELANALSSPRPFDEDGTGGWGFETVRETVEEARKEAGRDRDILDYLNTFERDLGKFEQTADRLNDLVRNMMNAVFSEDFDQVIINAQSLDSAWVDVRRRDGRWDGLQYLIRETYRQPLKDATLPKHHLENASRQNENLQSWKNWADETERLYNTVKQNAQELGREFDEVKQDGSLQKIVTDCDQAIRAVERLQARFNDKPTVDPLSEKAERNRDRVKVTAQNIIQTSLAQFKRLKQDAMDEQAKLTAPLTRLRGAMKVLKDLEVRQGAVPRAQVEMAQRIFRECEAIDPQNDELRDYRKQLQALKSR